MYGGQPVGMGNAGAFAGLDLPIPGGRLNRGGNLRENTRPGGQTETMPTRPMLPSEYGPAIDVKFRQAMGLGGMMPMGNVAGFANAQFYGGPQMTQVPPGMVKTVY
jgi:hypothetical protein